MELRSKAFQGFGPVVWEGRKSKRERRALLSGEAAGVLDAQGLSLFSIQMLLGPFGAWQ